MLCETASALPSLSPHSYSWHLSESCLNTRCLLQVWSNTLKNLCACPQGWNQSPSQMRTQGPVPVLQSSMLLRLPKGVLLQTSAGPCIAYPPQVGCKALSIQKLGKREPESVKG